MGKSEEREAFKQMALKMAKYRLRRVMSDAGCSPQEIREAEVEGEDRMIEIIMTKYDEGAIDRPGLEKIKNGGGAAPKEEPKEEKGNVKRTAKRDEKPKDDDDDPYAGAFGDDDEEAEGETNEEAKAQEDDDGDVENHEADPPRKAAERKAKKTEATATSDLSALEEKVDKLMSLTVSTVEAVVELREVVDKFVQSSTLFHEIVKMAFSRIWKLGAANPLKPGFGDVIAKAKAALGLSDEKSD